MKKVFGLLLALSMLLALGACSQSAPAPSATPAPTEDPIPMTPVPATPAPTEDPIPMTPVPETPAPTEAPVPAASGAGLVFSTTDREGRVWDQSALADYRLVMLNFWEPWCPPCVGEMPDLAKLSEAYADKGLLILGVYSTEDMEADVDKVLEQSGVRYPILHYTAAFDVFQSGYVPTTVFLNAAGETVGESWIGSRSYEAWAQIVDGLL